MQQIFDRVMQAVTWRCSIYLTAIVIAMLAFIAVLDAIRGSMVARFRPAGWIRRGAIV